MHETQHLVAIPRLERLTLSSPKPLANGLFSSEFSMRIIRAGVIAARSLVSCSLKLHIDVCKSLINNLGSMPNTTARVICRGSLKALREPWNSKAIESHSRKRGEWKSRPRHKPFPDRWIRRTRYKIRAVVLRASGKYDPYGVMAAVL